MTGPPPQPVAVIAGWEVSAARANGDLTPTDVVRDDVAGVRSYLLHCERSSGRYLFDALMSVGHDFGIEVGGFRAPGI